MQVHLVRLPIDRYWEVQYSVGRVPRRQGSYAPDHFPEQAALV